MAATPIMPRPAPSATPPRRDGSPLWLLLVVIFLVVAPMIGLSQLIAFWRTDVVDDQMFAYYGWRIAHGATVYVDVWDNKPPGIYWINAVGMLVSNGSYFGVIAMCALALAIAHAGFFVAASSVYSRGAAALATLLLSFYVTHADLTGGTNRTETFLIACEALAVAFYLRGWARDQWWKWYLAGVCCGLAFLFKQVGLAAWGAMGVHLIAAVLLGRLAFNAGLKRCLLLLVGAATTVSIAVSYLAARGALHEALFATFGFNQAYFDTGDSRFPYNIVTWSLLRDHFKPVLLLPLLMAIAAEVHAVLWWLRPQYRPPEIEKPLRAAQIDCPLYMFFFTLWFVVAVYGALLSPHGFRHYLVPTVPPLMFIAGYLVNVLRAETRLINRLQQRAWVTVAFIIMAYFAYEAVVRQFEEVSRILTFRLEPWLRDHGHYPPDTPGIGSYDLSHWEAVGDAVLRHTTPDQEIHCWGYMPGVYLQARRINACRFTTTEKIGQVEGGAQFIVAELEQCLRANPPALFTIEHGELIWLRNEDPSKPPSDFNLAPWLVENYTLVDEVPGFNVYIYKRNDLVTDAERRAAPVLE